MSGLQVMGGRVLVKPIESPTVTASGIELIEDKPPTYGRVIRVGTKHRCPECDTGIPVELQPGVIVGFSATAGQDVSMDGEIFTILRLDDVQFEWTPDTAQESA